MLRVRCPGPLGSCSPVCPLCVLCCVCSALGHSDPVHRCARSVCCVASAVSWAPWLEFTGVPARCVALRVRCPGPLGSCSPVCPLGALLCLCCVLGHLAPVHRCARSVCCLCVRCPGPLGSCSPVCPLAALLRVCGVLGHLAPFHRCARSLCCLACAVSWATWLLSTGVPAWSVALRVRCPGQLGSCSPVCLLGVLICLCGVLGHLAPVHRCVRAVRCFACAVSWATWLLFTGVPAWGVVLLVRCPGPFALCSPVSPFEVLCCVCGVTGRLAPVHRCARSACSVAFAGLWATLILFTGVPALCAVWRLRCPGPPGSSSPVCLLVALLHVCGVLGHLAPVHWCARSVCCLCVRCPGPLGSCSPVCLLGALLCVCAVLGHLAPFHRCARSLCCIACAVSWATWLLFTGVPARSVALRVRCPGPLGSCSPVCPLGVLICLCGVLGHLAPVHRCARAVRFFACAVSRATWLLFTGVPAWGVVLLVRCPGPFGSCSPMCPLGALFCFCGVLGHLAPVHPCACSVCCVACAVSWATWLQFTSVPARCVLLRVRCPGPLGSCSHVCSLGVLCFALCARDVAAGRSLVPPDGGYSR